MKRCAGGFDSQLAVPERQAVEMGVTVPYVCSVSHYGSDTVTVTLYCIAAVIDYRVAEAARRRGTSGANAARAAPFPPSRSRSARSLSPLGGAPAALRAAVSSSATRSTFVFHSLTRGWLARRTDSSCGGPRAATQFFRA